MALLNNKRRLLRLEKEQVVEVEAPSLRPEINQQAVEMKIVPPVSYPIKKETYLIEAPFPNAQASAQLEFHSSSDADYDQLKLQTLNSGATYNKN